MEKQLIVIILNFTSALYAYTSQYKYKMHVV